MFGRTPKITPIHDRPPLVFHGIELPEPSAEDQKWAEKFARYASKGKVDPLRKMLHKALINKHINRIAAGLRIQYQYPEQDFLAGGNPGKLYDDVWEADTKITEMYINTYAPTDPKHQRHQTLVSEFSSMAPQTRVEWAEKGAGEFLPAILCSFIKNEDFDRVKRILKNTNAEVTDQNCAALTTALYSGNKDIFNIILDAMPDNIDRQTGQIISQVISKADNETLQVLISRGLNILDYKDHVFERAQDKGRDDLMETLVNTYRQQSLDRRGLSADSDDKNWKPLAENFVKYARPTDETSHAEYQFDFNSGYMSYHYSHNDSAAQPVLKPISEVYRENPHLIEKAVQALVDAGHPAPEIFQSFNQAAPKTIKQARVPEKTAAPAPANTPKNTLPKC